MTVLRDLSLIWSLIHVLILFIFFYESRFPRKKTLILTTIFMVPLGALNIVGVILYGPELMGKLLFLSCTLPSLVFFFSIAKNRNWKFLFTFCFVDTVSYAILAVSRLIDFYLFDDKCIAMLIIRLLAFPLMEWLAYKYIRKPFLKIKKQLTSGWCSFTLITALYYALLLVMFSFPTMLIYRTEDVPAFLLVLGLMVLTYVGMYITLKNQLKLVGAESRGQILEAQAVALEQRLDEINHLEETLEIQRHDIRHRYSVISEMLRLGKTEGALKYINDSIEALDAVKETKFCENSVINAVFGYYVRKAEEKSIKTDIKIDVPNELELNVTELSVVIANALENAINACIELPENERCISCKIVSKPQFVLRISNSFKGVITFDSNGLPSTKEKGHGLGTHSIVAFCEKYEVYYEHKVENDLFVFGMMK